MDDDQRTASQKVFSEVQMKAIAALVGGLPEEVLKDHVGALQFEKGCRSSVRSISNLKKSAGLQINTSQV